MARRDFIERVTLDAALAWIDAAPARGTVEEVALAAAMGRILAEPVTFAADRPPFDLVSLPDRFVGGIVLWQIEPERALGLRHRKLQEKLLLPGSSGWRHGRRRRRQTEMMENSLDRRWVGDEGEHGHGNRFCWLRAPRTRQGLQVEEPLLILHLLSRVW